MHTLEYLKFRACERWKDLSLFNRLDHDESIKLLSYEQIRIKEEAEMFAGRKFKDL